MLQWLSFLFYSEDSSFSPSSSTLLLEFVIQVDNKGLFLHSNQVQYRFDIHNNLEENRKYNYKKCYCPSFNLRVSHLYTYTHSRTHALWQNKRSPSSAATRQAEPSAVVTASLSWSAASLTTSFTQHLLAVNHTQQTCMYVCVCVSVFPEAIDETVRERMRHVHHPSLSLFLSVAFLSPLSLSLSVPLITLCSAFSIHSSLHLPNTIISLHTITAHCFKLFTIKLLYQVDLSAPYMAWSHRSA